MVGKVDDRNVLTAADDDKSTNAHKIFTSALYDVTGAISDRRRCNWRPFILSNIVTVHHASQFQNYYENRHHIRKATAATTIFPGW